MHRNYTNKTLLIEAPQTENKEGRSQVKWRIIMEKEQGKEDNSKTDPKLNAELTTDNYLQSNNWVT